MFKDWFLIIEDNMFVIIYTFWFGCNRTMAKVVSKISAGNYVETNGAFVAGGSIIAGDPVMLSVSGNVIKAVADIEVPTWEARTTFNSWPSGDIRVKTATGTNTVAILYNESGYDLWYIQGATLSNGVLTRGAKVAVYQGAPSASIDITYIGTDGGGVYKYAVLRALSTPSNTVNLVFVTVTGTVVKVEALQQINTDAASRTKIEYDVLSNRIVCLWTTSSSYSVAIAYESSGIFTFGAVTTLSLDQQGELSVALMPGLNGIVINARYNTVVATYEPSSLVATFGTPASNNGANNSVGVGYDPVTGYIISFWTNGSTKAYTIFTVVGNVLTYQESSTLTYTPVNIIWNTLVSKLTLIGKTGSGNLDSRYLLFSGTTPSFGTANLHPTITSPSDTGADVVENTILTVSSSGSSRYSAVLTIPPGKWTSQHKIIGLSKNTVSSAETLGITTTGDVNQNLTGLSAGSAYYISSSGSLTTTATDNIFVGTALSVNQLYVGNGSIFSSGPLYPNQYKIINLPSVGDSTGGLIYVTDEVGGGSLAYSNGTNWLRIYDNAIIS
jgi:hypothetical protein